MANLKSQRQLIKETKKNQQKRRTLIAIIAVVAVIIIALLVWLLPRLGADKNIYAQQDGFSVGDPNAPVKVVEYSNYTCSHCRNFALNDEEAFVKKYVDTGKVYFTFHNFPFQGDSTGPGVAASHCAAEQNAFWQYKEQLFTYSGHPGGFDTNNLFSYASRLGLNRSAFKSCFESSATQAKIASDREAALAQNISATPTFVVNGLAVYLDTLESTIDAELAKIGQ
ncbi:MAG TPA: thioredoxin domain-containing protein [Anaerolineaceae bacterium]|nr:thioredoxin domain-containing protein [Anaerolineaceae bacterium]